MNAISVVLITKNAEMHLKECLESVSAFDDVTIYENGSSDSTLEIAGQFKNVTLHTGPFLGFGKSKAHAASLAKHDWVFALDADEPMSPELVSELLAMTLDDNAVYRVRRDNYYNGRHIKCCGWYPEQIVRLFNRSKTNYDDAMVHEQVEVKSLQIKELIHPIRHFSFPSVADFLEKIQKYSEIYAETHKGKKRASVAKAIFRGKSMFLKSYILKGGWRCGFEGFVISFFAGLGTTVKYLKLREKNLYDT